MIAEYEIIVRGMSYFETITLGSGYVLEVLERPPEHAMRTVCSAVKAWRVSRGYCVDYTFIVSIEFAFDPQVLVCAKINIMVRVLTKLLVPLQNTYWRSRPLHLHTQTVSHHFTAAY